MRVDDLHGRTRLEGNCGAVAVTIVVGPIVADACSFVLFAGGQNSDVDFWRAVNSLVGEICTPWGVAC